MAGTSGTILCAAAAAVLATAAPARAQPDQEPLSAAAVEDFFGRMEQDAVRMVRSGAFEELLDWVTDNIAEEATFAVSETFHAADGRRASPCSSWTGGTCWPSPGARSA